MRRRSTRQPVAEEEHVGAVATLLVSTERRVGTKGGRRRSIICATARTRGVVQPQWLGRSCGTTVKDEEGTTNAFSRIALPRHGTH